MLLSIIASVTVTIPVYTTTDVAELIAASASHVITAFVLVHPVLALGALLGARLLRPLEQLSVLGQLFVVNLEDFGFYLVLLELFTRLPDVIDYVALEAVFDVAHGATKVPLVVVLRVPNEKVPAFLRWTLSHVSVLIPDLLPFEFLTPLHLLWREQLSQVRQRYRRFAAGFRTDNRKLLALDASLDPC